MQMLEPDHFDEERASWVPGRPGSGHAAQGRLTVVTFNVWFGEFMQTARFDALLDTIRRCDPDVVGLQEVTPEHVEHVLAQDWIRRNYWVSDASARSVQPHGVFLLSRLPVHGVGLCELPSQKDRKLLVAELHVSGQPLTVGTVHLESSPDSTPLRLAQLDTVLPSLLGAPHAVLMGDFNFDPAQQAEQSRVEERYLDLWDVLRGDEPGYTEDTDINRMRLIHKRKEKRVRFDRILLRSASPGWVPSAIRRIGTDPISPGLPEVFPSDHFGLVGTLTWEGSAAGS